VETSTDGDGERREMSQAVATIYRSLFDELKFAKQQQWMTTNYLLLALAAIFGIGKAAGHLTACEKIIATVLILIAVVAGYYVLIDLQCHIGRIRKRFNRIEGKNAKFFNPAERCIVQLEEYTSPYLRGSSILIMLMGAAALGAILVEYAMWRSS
jgi:hypothetical protein